MEETTVLFKLQHVHAGSGRKVTSLLPVPGALGGLLVTSNDSRLRLFQRYTLVGDAGVWVRVQIQARVWVRVWVWARV